MRRVRWCLGLWLAVSLLLVGCSGVEPEKRVYPQVVAVDKKGEAFQIIFGLPNMQKATGQDKAEGEGKAAVLTFSGKNVNEINTLYNESQEKYLDLGHVNVLILGRGIRQDDLWEQVFCSFIREPGIGEDIYVFQTENVDEIMAYNGVGTDSMGDYLVGIYENRPLHQRREGVTLREAYRFWYESEDLIELPQLEISEQGYLRIAE